MLLDSCSQICTSRPRQGDAVGNVESSLLAAVLDESDDLTGLPSASQLGGNLQIESHRLTLLVDDAPAFPRTLGDDHIVSGHDGLTSLDLWYIHLDGPLDGQFGGKPLGIGSGNSGCDLRSGFSVLLA